MVYTECLHLQDLPFESGNGVLIRSLFPSLRTYMNSLGSPGCSILAAMELYSIYYNHTITLLHDLQ